MSPIIMAPLVVSVISGVLAAIIAIVDGIVNNYGEVKVKINGEKELTVNGGASLLTTLSETGIFVPSACGGRGSCGACKVKVLSDVGPHLPTETPLLTPEEMKENVRLSCQVKVKKDIDIWLPEELFNVKKYKTRIEKITDVTHDIKEVRFKLLEPTEVNFKAGQYMQIVIPPYDKIKEPTQRAYSISSVPSQKDSFELLIRLVPGGIATTYVHNYLKEGDTMEVIGPFGDFYLRDTDADVIGVAGGSGMAPLKSIILDMFEKGMTNRNVWYFFGARSLRDVYYIDLFKELEKKWPNLHFVVALSEPLPEDNWDGEVGLITDVLDKYFKEKMDPNTPKEGYLCGSPGMINACVNVMKNNGIPEDKIYYDKFA
ncbi:NADH:ubiquinone reductase (Na(+)-transporting) subunit F [Marinitoga litoralis]|uniref:NADH:ubiquinone reductase (Na(+)-transporting) subunit F n=1 Tax=Marinitoga litoralis TaxID=570855 RepID=UPI00195F9D01|nr:2Fe-2S iron-sulfur cluster binding domain-containing protein [Marinitoga litoralis]MBM7558337.1 Na+-transporting NADH:ubiquinone oxidoreductase subunit F [Marinitoga litoralis]